MWNVALRVNALSFQHSSNSVPYVCLAHSFTRVYRSTSWMRKHYKSELPQKQDKIIWLSTEKVVILTGCLFLQKTTHMWDSLWKDSLLVFFFIFYYLWWWPVMSCCEQKQIIKKQVTHAERIVRRSQAVVFMILST